MLIFFDFDSAGRRTAVKWFVAMWLSAAFAPLAAGQIVQPTSDLFENTAEPLVPKSGRSERDEDRLLAAAQFGFARMQLQREQLAPALRHYERAFRNDPSPYVAREIITVASQLTRNAEAVRYALLSAEIQPPGGDLSLRLAAILGEQGQFSRAVRLLEFVAHNESQPVTGLSAILLRAELMRMYFMAEQFELAGKSADVVRDALQTPEKFGLSPADQQKLKSQRDRIHPLIAESYLLAKRYADAEAAFRAAHEAKPNEASLNLGLARIAAEQKDWKAARERLTVYFREKSTAGGMEPYAVLAKIIAGETGDEARAKAETVTALQQLREQDPKNNPLGYATAAKLLANDRLDEAAKLYEELLTKQPTTTAYRDLVQIYRKKKDSQGLLRVLAGAVDQGTARAVLSAEGKGLEQDAELVNALVELLRSPAKEHVALQTSSAFVAICLLTLDVGKVDVARDLYERALKAPGNDAVKIRETIGLAALVGEQHQLAIDVLQQAIAAQPPQDKLAAYHYYLSGALEFAGDTDGALAAAEKCATLKRDSAQFQTRPAWVLYHAHRLEQAEQRYREVIAKFDMKYESEEVREQVRQARLILSNICVLQKRIPEAEEWLEQVLDEFPENIGAMNDLGYLWADQGKRLQRALKMIEQAVAADTDNAAYRDSLGWAYFRLGRFTDAIRELERAATTAKDGVIYDHLGDVYLKIDDRKQAVAAWKKGVELMRDNDDAAQRAAITEKINQHSEPSNK